MKITTSQDVLLAQIEMTEIAEKYAHRMAMLLECIVMSVPSGTAYWDEAINVLGKYRGEMNAIHERESPPDQRDAGPIRIRQQRLLPQ